MNDTTQSDRTWSDAFGLVLFAVGSITGALLFKTLTHTEIIGEDPTWAVQTGYALVWATGPVPVSMMSLACFFIGAAQFLGYQGSKHAARHLGGVFGISVGLSIVLGAYSPDAGGRLGVIIGGGITDLVAAPMAALVGLGLACYSIWAAWMTPDRATTWERSQEIEKPAVSLQAKADGVTSEESAALAFEGDPGAFPGVVESPYPEDVRVHGQIPDGAAALGAEETSNHVEIEEESGTEERAEGAPGGAEGPAEAEPEGDDLSLDAEQGDAGSLGEDMAVSGETSERYSTDEAEPEDELTEAQGSTAEVFEESALLETDVETPSLGEAVEYEASEEWEGEAEVEWEEAEDDSELDEEGELEEVDHSEYVEEQAEEEEAEYEEGAEEPADEEEYEEEAELEDAAEHEEEAEELADEEEYEEEAELEDAAEYEEEAEAPADEEEYEEEEAEELADEEEYEEEAELEDAAEYEEEAEAPADEEEYEEEEAEEPADEGGGELEEAAQLEEDEVTPTPEPGGLSVEQGDLFDMGEGDAAEADVILEPQAKPAGTTEEVLLKAADLFLDRDRVAVSLLQRQFQLDFEESCAVLDELQERGLIGPYLGGNRRDILLTREEWLERVGGAT